MRPIPVIAGPTASGKTRLALAVAESLGAEIISADSRQVYRELTIGTAKPTIAERARIRHHFIDERSLDEPWSAGRFEAEARRRITKIKNRGTQVVIVGGSTLYIHALMYGLADIPDVDPDIVAHTYRELQEYGSARLHDALRAVDPAAANRIDPTKSHRIARALAVFRSTGRPIDWFFESARRDPEFRLILLERDRRELYERINRRVDRMLDEGLVEEVHDLFNRGFDTTVRPLRSIGYAELLEHFASSTDRDESIRLIKRNSRRYAKRQMTWFRRYTEALRLDANAPVDALIERILAEIGAGSLSHRSTATVSSDPS